MEFSPDEYGLLAQIRHTISGLRDRSHEQQVQLDTDMRVLDGLIRLLDAIDDDRINNGLHAATVKAVRRGLHVVGDNAS